MGVGILILMIVMMYIGARCIHQKNQRNTIINEESQGILKDRTLPLNYILRWINISE